MRGILCEGNTGLTTKGLSITGGRLIGGCDGLIGGCGGLIVGCGGLIDGCGGKLTTGAGSRTGKASYFGSSSL